MNHVTIGDRVPDVTFKTRVRDENVDGENPFTWKDVKTEEIFAGKKIVIFALPGAFTPTCSSTHLPGYEDHFETFKEMGVDQVICLSVNDAFVMFNWQKHMGIEKVFMLPDGNGDFTDGMGMLVKKENLGFGKRSWRYSMLVEDSEIKEMFAEEGFSDNHDEDPFVVSGAETMIKALRARSE